MYFTFLQIETKSNINWKWSSRKISKKHCPKTLTYIERKVIHKQVVLTNVLSRILPTFLELLFKGAHFNDCFRTIELRKTLYKTL